MKKNQTTGAIPDKDWKAKANKLIRMSKKGRREPHDFSMEEDISGGQEGEERKKKRKNE